MSFRTSLIVLNVVAAAVLVAFVVWRVLSLRRNPDAKPPANLTPFLRDDDLEGRRLERALGWALLFVLVIAVALPVYFLIEPERQQAAAEGFLERSIERGATLFANSQSKAYDPTKSLLCANCHGVDAQGGTATYTLQPESDLCLQAQNQGRADVPQCLPKQVAWQAPPLDTVLLRFDRDQVTQIINYGRPGTPMPAWGVISGKGVLNEQGVEDLVNYLESIQISSKKAIERSTKALADYKKQWADNADRQDAALVTARNNLAAAQASGASADTIAVLQAEVTTAQQRAAQARAWSNQVNAMSDGEILFRLNCARCHTKGASYFDPNRLDLPAPAPSGSGAFGPSLVGDAVEEQFPGLAGEQEQFDWIAEGVPANDLYGVRGISSGRMPHFAKQLTEAQIKAIVAYERSL